VTRAEKMIIALMGSSHSLNHGYILIFPAVLALLKAEFSLGYFALGVISNIMGFTYGLGAFPGGLIYNRIGPRKVYLICFLGCAAASLFITASPNLYFLTIGLALLGALGSVYHPLANSLITSKVREYGRALGIHGSAGNIGMAAGPFLAGLIASHWGWRYAYLWFAVPGICLSLWALSIDMSAGSKAKDKTEKQPPSSPKIREYFSFPLVCLYMLNTFNAACFFGSVTFLPTFMAQRTSFHIFSLDSVAIGGLLSGIVLLTGVFGQLVGGSLAQRGRLERNFFLVVMTMFPLLFSMSLTTNIFLVILAVVYFFFNFALQPMNNALVARHTTVEMRGTAFGIYFSVSFALGSLSATLTGYIAQNIGLQWVFLGLSFMSLLLLVFARMLIKLKGPVYTKMPAA
jgi:MFS family permease